MCHISCCTSSPGRKEPHGKKHFSEDADGANAAPIKNGDGSKSNECMNAVHVPSISWNTRETASGAERLETSERLRVVIIPTEHSYEKEEAKAHNSLLIRLIVRVCNLGQRIRGHEVYSYSCMVSTLLELHAQGQLGYTMQKRGLTLLR